MRRPEWIAAPAVLLAMTMNFSGCTSEPAEAPVQEQPVETAVPEPEQLPELIPPGPGEEGGLPDDRTPVSEGPIEPDSAQGAAQIVQRYGAYLEAGRFADAYRLWAEDGQASAQSEEEFAAGYADYTEIHALVGAPNDPEGAAGSVYVTVPLQLYGRTQEGGTYNLIGPVTLRRVNDVPGSSEAERRWQISNAALVARGTVREATSGDTAAEGAPAGGETTGE